ncbi:MAG: hypothetical protein H0X63_12320 [Flavobacteriales bacterium]|nr:hypothetical protein [Flavobacteriales bacterium]
MKRKQITKEELVAEYLTGKISYRALEVKYGIHNRTICGWVLEFQGRVPTHREKMRRKREKESGVKEVELSNEVKILQAELRKARLQNKLLEEIIHISEEQTGIDFKKKFGTKQ